MANLHGTKVILTKGLPASGKSTWAKAEVEKSNGILIRISKDDLRAMLHNGKWSPQNEKTILAMRDALIINALQAGKNVIVDDTNLSPKHLDHIKQLVSERFDDEVEITIQDFTDVLVGTCISRDNNRPNPVGAKVIIGMYNQFLRPQPKKVEVNPDLPYAVICDLDGTLCLFEGNPYDRDFSKDRPNLKVIRLLSLYHNAGFRIIFVSGRKSTFERQTWNWLETYVSAISEDVTTKLFMRDGEDNRGDDIIKQEIYEKYIKDCYNVECVIDDRKRVKRFWVNEGIFVFDVNQNDAEF